MRCAKVQHCELNRTNMTWVSHCQYPAVSPLSSVVKIHDILSHIRSKARWALAGVIPRKQITATTRIFTVCQLWLTSNCRCRAANVIWAAGWINGFTQAFAQSVGRGGDLGGTGGGSSPQKVRWRERRCFYPPIFRKCLANLHCKKDKNERERRWDPCDRDRHTSIMLFPYYCDTV